MILQDEEKSAKLFRRAATEVEACSTAHASHPLSRTLCECALSEVLAQIKESEMYVSVQTHPNRWLVSRGATRVEPESGRPVPLYVRSVTISDSHELMCSCGHYEQNGFPCRHLIHVLSGHFKRDIEEHDFDVRVWRNYAHVVLDEQDSTETYDIALKEKLIGLTQTPKIGPLVLEDPEGINRLPHLVVGRGCENDYIPPSAEEFVFQLDQIIYRPLRYKNYTKVVMSGRTVATATAEGYTQETNASKEDGEDAFMNREDDDESCSGVGRGRYWFGNGVSHLAKEMAKAAYEAEKKGHSEEIMEEGYDLVTKALNFIQKLSFEDVEGPQKGNVISCLGRVRNPDLQHKKQKLAGLSQSKS